MSVDVIQVAKLVEMYMAKDGRINPWFPRRMKEVSVEVRDAVYAKLRSMGLDKIDRAEAIEKLGAQPPRPQKQKETLTDADWDTLAEKVFASFAKPSARLFQVANKMMAQLPKDRQKRIGVKNAEPLIKRLETRLATLTKAESEAKEAQAKLESLRAELASKPTKEQIITQFSDAEIVQYFGQRLARLLTPHELLSHVSEDIVVESIPTPILVGKAVQRTMEMWQDTNSSFASALIALKDELERKSIAFQSKKATQTAIPLPSPLPKIAVMGMLANQFQTLAEKLAGKAKFHYIDKNMSNGETIPSGCNYIVLWTRFCSHAMQDQAKAKAQGGTELIRHHGGIDTLVKKLETMLK